MIDKLRELQEQASPGPWAAGKKSSIHATDKSREGDARWVLRDDSSFACFSSEQRAKDIEWARRAANAKLAALATHLFPLAEALEKECCPYLDEGKSCSERAPIEDQCPRCKVLTALQEALDE